MRNVESWGKPKFRCLRLVFICVVLVVATTKQAAAGPVETTDSAAKQANEVAGAIANFYGSYQAAVFAAQYLGILQSPTPPPTLTQIKQVIDNAAAATDWQLSALEVTHIQGALKEARELAIDCNRIGNCDIWGSMETPTYDSGAKVYEFVGAEGSPGWTYFMRYKNFDLPFPFYSYAYWAGLIPDPDSRGFVYDWRGALPIYLSALTERLAYLATVDSANYQLDFGQELSDHANNLWTHYLKMRDGIRCTFGWDDDTANEQVNCMPQFPTEFCVDVYSGTYAQQYLGGSRCAPGINDAEKALIPAADIALTRQVYDALPLAQMKHLVSQLQLLVNPRPHGFLIEADGGAEPEYLNAFGGADEGVELRLHPYCDTNNPDCTWQYNNGMLLSDRDPSLCVVLGSCQGIYSSSCTSMQLTRYSCTPNNPKAVWWYDRGAWINAGGGPVYPYGSVYALDGTQYCSTIGFWNSNLLPPGFGVPPVTSIWTMPHVMFTPDNAVGGPATPPAVLAMRATGPDGTGDAQNTGLLISDPWCTPNNPNCTWTVTQGGMIFNDKDPSLALNAWGGAGSGMLKVVNWGSAGNLDCKWKLFSNQIGTDNGNELVQYSEYGWTTMALNPPGNYFLQSFNFSMTRAAD